MIELELPLCYQNQGYEERLSVGRGSCFDQPVSISEHRVLSVLFSLHKEVRRYNKIFVPQIIARSWSPHSCFCISQQQQLSELNNHDKNHTCHLPLDNFDAETVKLCFNCSAVCTTDIR